MAAAGGDQGIISRPEALRLLRTVKQQAGAARQNQYPLVPLLVVPLPLRSGLAVGNDPLDADGI